MVPLVVSIVVADVVGCSVVTDVFGVDVGIFVPVD